MKSKTRRILSISLNVIIFLMVIYAVVSQFISSNQFGSSGWVIFRYYTVLSNSLAGITAAIMFVSELLGKTDSAFSKLAGIMKYTGTTGVTVTFLTVMFFLGPLYGYILMLTGPSLYMHLIIPVLCIVSFLLFDGIKGQKPSVIIFPVALTIIYGAFYVVNVVLIGEQNGGWNDFYGFNLSGTWYLSVILMLAATVLISFLLYFFRKKIK